MKQAPFVFIEFNKTHKKRIKLELQNFFNSSNTNLEVSIDSLSEFSKDKDIKITIHYSEL